MKIKIKKQSNLKRKDKNTQLENKGNQQIKRKRISASPVIKAYVTVKKLDIQGIPLYTYSPSPKEAILLDHQEKKKLLHHRKEAHVQKEISPYIQNPTQKIMVVSRFLWSDIVATQQPPFSRMATPPSLCLPPCTCHQLPHS